MGSMRRSIVLVAVAGLFLTACEEKKPARTNPPAQAMAPAVQPQTTPPASQSAAQAEQTPAPQRPVVNPTPVDPVPGLIEASERAYQQGQTEYKAGHLGSAKAAFDKAVTILMEGPVDVASDDRLRAQFDK